MDLGGSSFGKTVKSKPSRVAYCLISSWQRTWRKPRCPRQPCWAWMRRAPRVSNITHRRRVFTESHPVVITLTGRPPQRDRNLKQLRKALLGRVDYIRRVHPFLDDAAVAAEDLMTPAGALERLGSLLRITGENLISGLAEMGGGLDRSQMSLATDRLAPFRRGQPCWCRLCGQAAHRLQLDHPVRTAWSSLCLMSKSSILLNSSGGILWIRCWAAYTPSS